MKYAALLLNLVAVAVLGWGISDLAGKGRPGTASGLAPAVPEIGAVSEAEMMEQQATLAALDRIGRLGGADALAKQTPGGTLVALPAPGAPGSDLPGMPERRLSLIASMDGAHVAIVDGELVRKGDRLPGGAKVLAVRPGQVAVRERQGRQKLALDMAKARVGTTVLGPAAPVAGGNTQ